MIDQLRGSFRTAAGSGGSGYLINVADMLFTGNSTWTPGAVIIDRLDSSARPALNEKWNVISVAVVAKLVYLTTRHVETWGKLGKIVAGVLIDAQTGGSVNPTIGPNQTPYVGGQNTISAQLPPLPDDPTLSADLWNPATDPMPQQMESNGVLIPPTFTNGVFSLLDVVALVNLPLPRELQPGGEIGVGIWMLPGLVENDNQVLGEYGLAVCNARYVVTYYDGR